ncbi:MAG: hypothetical protein P4L71_00385 [Acetobacteraceae bacterium]|nr:hypothetical protein [Acetobacteraceae bacterium]
MALYYAKSTGGFYDSGIGTPPSDAVEITAAQHTALLAAQATGQVIQADANGNPEAVTVTSAMPLPHQAKAALASSDTTMHRVAEAVALAKTTWTAADVVAFATWRRALRAIMDGTDTTSTALPTKPAYPSGT